MHLPGLHGKLSSGPSSLTVLFIMLLIVISPALAMVSPASGTPLVSSNSSNTSPPGGDWTSFTLNTNNSRYQSASTITASNVAKLAQKWFIDTQYGVTGTPLVQNGVVYFADWGGNVYAANANTGSIIWQTNLGGAISSTLALSNGMVFVGFGPAYDTEVEALSQATGSVVWSVTLPTTENAIWASPIVYNGLVYIGVSSAGQENKSSWVGELFALNENTGSTVWTFRAAGTSGGAGVWGSVVVDPTLNSIYFGTGNSYTPSGTIGYAYSIVSLNAATGKLNWYYQIYPNHVVGGDQDFGSTPNLFTIGINGVTYNAVGLGNKNGWYYVLNRETGALLGKYQVGSAEPGGIIGVPGFTYLDNVSTNPEVFVPALLDHSGDLGIVQALLPSSHHVEWNYFTPGVMTGSVALVPGAVLFGDGNGNLFALSQSTGKVLFRTTLPYGIQGGVTVAEGLVLVGDFGDTFASTPNTGLYAFAA